MDPRGSEREGESTVSEARYFLSHEIRAALTYVKSDVATAGARRQHRGTVPFREICQRRDVRRYNRDSDVGT